MDGPTKMVSDFLRIARGLKPRPRPSWANQRKWLLANRPNLSKQRRRRIGSTRCKPEYCAVEKIAASTFGTWGERESLVGTKVCVPRPHCVMTDWTCKEDQIAQSMVHVAGSTASRAYITGGPEGDTEMKINRPYGFSNPNMGIDYWKDRFLFTRSSFRGLQTDPGSPRPISAVGTVIAKAKQQTGNLAPRYTRPMTVFCPPTPLAADEL